MSELDQLRQEAEQLKNQIRVSEKKKVNKYVWISMSLRHFRTWLSEELKMWLYFQDARKACADATLSQVVITIKTLFLKVIFIRF